MLLMYLQLERIYIYVKLHYKAIKLKSSDLRDLCHKIEDSRKKCANERIYA